MTFLKRKSLLYQWLAVVATILASGADWACTTIKTQSQEEIARSRTSYAGLTDSAQYVGIQTCASCHPNVHSTYIHTGMGSSFGKATREKSAADFSGHPVVHDPYRNLNYHPYWNGDSLYFREFRLDGRDTTHLREERIEYVVGSGQHTNSHLWSSNGYLYQAPLTYYTQKGTWDLPPGFENGNNTRFNRIIGAECMTCHNGLPDFVKGSSNKYALVKGGIDCERCHGPGSIHVREKSMGILIDTSKSIDYSIVNPAKLPIDLQFDVCQRCHIQGNAVLQPGKSFEDFRPGMKLSEVMHVFMPVYEDNGEQHIMASHAERLRMSACFLESNKNLGKSVGLKPYQNGMTCITCHNPHISVRKDGPERFNTVCRNCHQDAGDKKCSESQVVRSRSQDNCSGCHMPLHGAADIPHVSIHDHRIGIHKQQTGRKQTADILKGIRCIHETRVSPFTEAEAFVNYVEKFDMSVALLDSAENRLRSCKLNKEVTCLRIRIAYLRKDYVQIRNLVKSDADLLGSLNKVESENRDAWTAYRVAEAFQVNAELKSQANEALRWFEKAKNLAPLVPDFTNKLGSAYASAGRLNEAEKCFTFLVSEHPSFAPGYCNLGYLRYTQGRKEDAKYLLEKAIRLDPDYALAHMNLASLHLSTGNRAAAIKALTSVIRLNPDNQQARAALQQIKSN